MFGWGYSCENRLVAQKWQSTFNDAQFKEAHISHFTLELHYCLLRTSGKCRLMPYSDIHWCCYFPRMARHCCDIIFNHFIIGQSVCVIVSMFHDLRFYIRRASFADCKCSLYDFVVYDSYAHVYEMLESLHEILRSSLVPIWIMSLKFEESLISWSLLCLIMGFEWNAAWIFLLISCDHRRYFHTKRFQL